VRTVVAISVGCPCGIGPEVAVAAAARARDVKVVLVGDPWVIDRAAKIVGVPRKRLSTYLPSARLPEQGAPFGRPTAAAGRAQLRWIDQATDLVVSGEAQALVTGPVSKHAIAASGGRAKGFRGHTEHLARRLGSREVVMAFWSERLVISLVTTHLPIALVPRAITPAKVAMAAFHTVQLVRRLGKRVPRVVVAALNPHAGEQGLLGNEEIRRIAPGIASARRRLSRGHLRAVLDGPIGAETAIRKAAAGAYDAVVAMYHDQATIPMKLIGFGDAVNVTLGLPIVRTSVDHGTGYDIAGTGQADARGMLEAIALAVKLAKR
jgi:4-hydroxythreonine-4-phosphate dehydrogenase